MKENFDRKIKGIEIQNFSLFDNLKLDFSSGINIFIGENGTGKTHLLKLLYALVLKNSEYDFRKFQFEQEGKKGAEKTMNILLNLTAVFRDIAKNQVENESYNIQLFYNNESHFDFKFKGNKDALNTQLLPLDNDFSDLFTLKPLFIPHQEMLSLFRGFAAAYELRESSFDATYYHLAKSLSLLPLRHQAIPNRAELLDKFMNDTQILVTQLNGEFFVHIKHKDSKVFNASDTATGINKLAQMIYLIQNGSLTNNTILFWDEPETNLNPRYIKIVAEFLQTLAKNGVQIFVATHDYLLAHLLSLAAEYRTAKAAPPMQFFAFHREGNYTTIESAESLAYIQNNAMLDEYANYYDLEQNLFKQTMT